MSSVFNSSVLSQVFIVHLAEAHRFERRNRLGVAVSQTVTQRRVTVLVLGANAHAAAFQLSSSYLTHLSVSRRIVSYLHEGLFRSLTSVVLEAYVGFRYTAAIILFCLGLFLSSMTILLSHALQTTVLSVISINAMARFFDRCFFSALFYVGKPFQNLLTARFTIVDIFFHDFIGL